LPKPCHYQDNPVRNEHHVLDTRGWSYESTATRRFTTRPMVTRTSKFELVSEPSLHRTVLSDTHWVAVHPVAPARTAGLVSSTPNPLPITDIVLPPNVCEFDGVIFARAGQSKV